MKSIRRMDAKEELAAETAFVENNKIGKVPKTLELRKIRDIIGAELAKANSAEKGIPCSEISALQNMGKTLPPGFVVKMSPDVLGREQNRESLSGEGK